MKTVFIPFFLLASFCLKGQNNETWYKVYTGKIGNLSATLHLHRADKNFSGYIWFDQNQWPMPVYSGEPVAKTDSINISTGSGPVTLNLTGVFNNNNFSGTALLQKEGSGSKKSGFQLMVNDEKKITAFDYFFTHGTAKLLPEIKNESEGDYLAATIWPKNNSAVEIAIKKQLQKTFKIPATVTDPAKWLTSEKAKYLSSWKKENSKLSPKEASEMGMSLSIQEEHKVLIMYEDENHITVADYGYSFTGGAHGNYGTALTTYDKQTGKNLKLSDVVNPAGIKALPALLDRVARLQYSIKNNNPLDQNNFLVKKITPAENFYVTTSGIGFLYAPYEIKSFADGEINLLVPFSALTNYLQPGFKH